MFLKEGIELVVFVCIGYKFDWKVVVVVGWAVVRKIVKWRKLESDCWV